MIHFFSPFLTFVALLIGIVSSMLGLGGGTLIVPVLTLLFGVDIHQAIGTSLFTIFFMSTSSSIAYSIQKRVDYLLCIILASCTIPGGILGAYSTSLIDSAGLTVVFGVIVIIAAIRFLIKETISFNSIQMGGTWHRRIIDSQGEVFEYDINLIMGMVFGVLAGFVSGFLGVGGGVIMVPVLRLIVGLPMHIVISTSLLIMVLTSISGSLIHVNLGHINFEYAFLLIIGIIIGAQIGPKIAQKLPGYFLQKIFGIILFIMGLRMILNFFL